jgi:hypothetical protein
MALEDILKFKLRRVNPFQGLIIDADIWRDAHNYHREAQRLHLLTLHNTGIIEGLNVTANNPEDLSVKIHPGAAIDPEGNVIIVPQEQRYQLQTRQKGMIYLVIQFREVPGEPYQPPDGGQPTRIIEAYRIQERDKLPSEPYLELARIDFDPAEETIKDARTPSRPAKNEIDLRQRLKMTEKSAPPEAVAAPVVPERVTVVTEAGPAKTTVFLGYAELGEGNKNLHLDGLSNLVRTVNWQSNLDVKVIENIPLDDGILRCTLIYLAGASKFELTPDQQAALGTFLKEGGVIFGEGCSEQGEEGRGAKAFGLAFNELAGQLDRKLEIVRRGHPVLNSVHLFSEIPPGAGPGMLLEGGHMIYSGSDYGCAWQGGREGSLLPRDVVRASFEMGTNIIAYAYGSKAGS